MSVPQPMPANTMIGYALHPARLGVNINDANEAGPRIVHIQFKRSVYSDCHMMLSPRAAVRMGLRLIWNAFVAAVWLGKVA